MSKMVNELRHFNTSLRNEIPGNCFVAARERRKIGAEIILERVAKILENEVICQGLARSCFCLVPL